MVYAAPDEAAALEELESFGEKWNSKYPKIYKSWSERWATLSTYFKYPNEVRKLIYTTNAIEGFNRQLRKVTKSKTVFPSDDSLLKMLYGEALYKPEMKEGNPIRLYSLDEITEIFCKLGLRICNSFADFSGKPSSDNDIQLMVYSIRE